RFPMLAGVGHAPRDPSVSPILCLEQAGFADAYRLRYPWPTAAFEEGFTYYGRSPAGETRSRIDYCWVRGFTTPADQMSCVHVAAVDDDRDRRSPSRHRLLWVSVSLARRGDAMGMPDPMRLTLPNLRVASADQLGDFTERLESDLAGESANLRRWAALGDAQS